MNSLKQSPANNTDMILDELSLEKSSKQNSDLENE